MRVLVVGEGPDDIGPLEDDTVAGPLEVLLFRLLGEPHDWDCDRQSFLVRTSRHIHPDVKNKGHKDARRVKRFMIEAGGDGYEALFVVVDRDADRAKERAVRRAPDELRQETPAAFAIETVVGVAIETFDAWMLADDQAVSEVLGCDASAEGHPESLAGAPNTKDHTKTRMDGLIRSSASAGKHRWQLYPRIAEKASLARLKRKCPKGFGRFAKEVRAVGAASGSEGERGREKRRRQSDGRSSRDGNA